MTKTLTIEEKIGLRKKNGFRYMEWDTDGYNELLQELSTKRVVPIQTKEHITYMDIDHYLNNSWPSPESL